VELYALLNQRDQEAIARHNLAQALRQLDRIEAARQQLEQAASLNQALGCQAEWWRNQIALIQLASGQGDQTNVASYFQKLLDRADQIKDPGTCALFWNEAGLWHLQNGDMARANAALGEAEKGFAHAGDTAGWATALANQALVLEKKGQFQAAQTLWQTAQTKFEQVGDAMGIASALAGQGRVLLRGKTDLARAEDLLRRAARSYERLQATLALAATRALLEEAMRLQGRGEDAETPRRGDAEFRSKGPSKVVFIRLHQKGKTRNSEAKAPAKWSSFVCPHSSAPEREDAETRRRGDAETPRRGIPKQRPQQSGLHSSAPIRLHQKGKTRRRVLGIGVFGYCSAGWNVGKVGQS
jgi:tetratricopeptide (TPR) repeat protein